MKNLLILCLLSMFILNTLAQQHVQWRGENRDGKYPETGLLDSWPDEGPEFLWYYKGIGDGHGSVAVLEDKILTSGTLDEEGYVFAFDNSGALLWKSAIGKSWTDNWNGVRTTPMIYEGKIYIMTAFGHLNCLNVESGEKVWDLDLFSKFNGRNIRWGVTENLILDDGKLYVTLGGVQANVIALDPENGDLIWKCKGNGEKSSYNSPALIQRGGLKIIVTHTENHILGIDASNGDLLWSYEHINEWSVHPNTPLYRDGQVYCFSGYGKGGVALKLSEDGKSVSKLWENTSLDNQMGGVILLGNRLYGMGHNNRKIICLDWNSGEELFSSRTIQRGNTIYADNKLFCYDERGKVFLVKPGETSFDILSTFSVPYGENQHWAHLVIDGDRLFVRHGNALMVYKIAK